MATRNRCPVVLVAAALTAFSTAPARAAAEPETTRVSLSTNGIESFDGDASVPAISANGEFVAFTSDATKLVSADTNGVSDVFVRELQTGVTTRVSVDSVGAQGTGASGSPAISADGRFVAFESAAENLVSDDSNTKSDVFIHDRQTGETTRVSVNSRGGQATGDSYAPSLNADGRIVAFASDATDLVTFDTKGKTDAFVHDRLTGDTTRVSVGPSAVEADGDSNHPDISGDGRVVAFASDATNLLSAMDGNTKRDVFVHDRVTNGTRRVNMGSGGAAPDDASDFPSVNGDGSAVAYQSKATNLVPGDTNMKEDVFVTRGSRTARVSLDAKGVQGNEASAIARISADGLSVVFMSLANNLVPSDLNGALDIFVSRGGKAVRVNLGPDGAEGDLDSFGPAISGDGRIVTFASAATTLVDDDSNGRTDAFVSVLKPTHHGLTLFGS